MINRMLPMAFALTALCLSAVVQALEVENAYVREPIPGRYMSAAFMTIKNAGDRKRTLVGAKADWAGLMEIHTHLNDDGVMRMRQLKRLEIPAGESVMLEPGGLHLMLFKLAVPLTADSPLAFELCFADGECVPAQAELRSLRD